MAKTKHNVTLRRAAKAGRIMLFMLSLCMFRASVLAISDAARFFCKHYILSIVIIGLYGWMFVSLANARIERDKYNATAVEYQLRNQNLEMMVKK